VQNQLHGAISSTSRRTRAPQLAHYQAQVAYSYMSQLPLQNVLSFPQVAAPHAASFVAMRKVAFHKLAAPPE